MINFKNIKVLVIGDIILDEYISGDVLRLSPEAPIPIIKSKEVTHSLGGAGNVANNIVNLGGSATLLSCYENDTNGFFLNELCKKENYKVKTKTICCYPTENNFLESHAALIKKTLKTLENKNFKLLFSAHGLPENKIKKGDPYQWQVEKTVEGIMSKLTSENLDFLISYQSRVGPLKWIGPSTDEMIIKYSKENKGIVIVPVAFVSEHSETLVELDIEYKRLAEKNGCIFYKRIPALGIEENFIKSLTELVVQPETRGNFVSSVMCPNKFKKCPCLEV